MTRVSTELQKRIAEEEAGFTLIELLMVLVIIGVLLAIAVPSYLGFKDRADKSAAQSNVRSAIPAAETYYADHHNYTGMDVTALRAIGPGIRVDVVTVPTSTSYTLCAISGDWHATASGPGGSIVVVAGNTCS